MRSRVARIHVVARPRDRQPPRGEEATTLPTLRAAVNPAPIAAQPPPFLALESVPCLGEKSRRPSTPEIVDSPPGIADRRSDRRPSTLEFAAERS
ncbi:hypothetical protein BHM03_00019672 [Ensete ventricosum]|uniref:Uncharacterized protein n=1 Tax=Ensete ventricosum TaxID=4639 RepID=A0A445MFS8_ENSVE|nr:hypothetical protein BHM03_00019672 [Ensete ventricosum]